MGQRRSIVKRGRKAEPQREPTTRRRAPARVAAPAKAPVDAPLAVIGYARVSTDQQGASLEEQRRRIEAYAELRGYRLIGIHSDEGASGALWERAGLQKALEQLRSGQAQAIMVTAIDRLTRSVRHLLDVVAVLQEHQANLVSVTEAIDTGTPIGRAVLTILGVVAEIEREAIKERIQASKRYNSAQGNYLGGAIPYGRRLSKKGELVPDRHEMAILKLIEYERQHGAGYAAIARTLTTQGYLTRTKKAWRSNYVAAICAANKWF